MPPETKRLPATFYQTPDGAEPVRDWLRRLPAADRRIIGHDIALVEFGWPVGMPLCRPLGDGLWEIRSRLGDGKIARVIFCVTQGQLALLHGFIIEDAEDTGSRPKFGFAAKKGTRMIEGKGRLGSSFDDFLREEGIYHEVAALAAQRVLAWQVGQAMREQGLTKSEVVESNRRKVTDVVRRHLPEAMADPKALETLEAWFRPS